ncbi:MAG: DUF3817 domain-containing protein [Mycetocola sp.]
MALEPRERDLPRIKKALTFYKISSIITGILLLGLVAEMIIKYGFDVVLEVGGTGGGFALVHEDAVTGFNLFTALLVAHGWFYVVYLFSDFHLWSLMRWPFTRFLLIALGGIIPLLSFFLEARIGREVTNYLAKRQAASHTLEDSH